MKYVFDRQKLKEAIAPVTLQELFYSMKLTPSQMQIFFYSEPSVGKLIKIAEFTNISPLKLVKPYVKKGEEHESEPETPIHQNECLAENHSDN